MGNRDKAKAWKALRQKGQGYKLKDRGGRGMKHPRGKEEHSRGPRRRG
jgi:hypothetical protein